MKTKDQTLAQINTLSKDSPGRRCESFLAELANMRPGDDAAKRLLKAYAAFLPPWLNLPEREIEKYFGKMTVSRGGLVVMKGHIQSVWGASDLLTAEWRIFELRRFNKILSEQFEPGTADWNWQEPPKRSPFELAMLHLRKNLHRTLHCKNPDCPARYFFQTKKGQKFCSDACSSVGQREYKRRWWAEHGQENRKKRGRGKA